LNELEEYGVAVHSIKEDVGSVKECERLAWEAIAWSPTGGVDILISNAGGGKRTDWFDVQLFMFLAKVKVTVDEWDELFAINTRPSFILTKRLSTI